MNRQVHKRIERAMGNLLTARGVMARERHNELLPQIDRDIVALKTLKKLARGAEQTERDILRAQQGGDEGLARRLRPQLVAARQALADSLGLPVSELGD